MSHLLVGLPVLMLTLIYLLQYSCVFLVVRLVFALCFRSAPSGHKVVDLAGVSLQGSAEVPLPFHVQQDPGTE
jgi:hypothetical protein